VPPRPGNRRDDELQLAAAYRAALRHFLRRTEVIAARSGLTPERYDLLLAIKAATAAGRPATVSMLSKELELRQQAVTENVKRAEEAGLLRRSRSTADGRVYHLSLTAEGDARVTETFRALGRARAALAGALRELNRHFRAAAPPARSRAAAGSGAVTEPARAERTRGAAAARRRPRTGR
jgi:DNA-binding MarR family transcriptional regulator